MLLPEDWACDIYRKLYAACVVIDDRQLGIMYIAKEGVQYCLV
jgi:hypothetical protein